MYLCHSINIDYLDNNNIFFIHSPSKWAPHFDFSSRNNKKTKQNTTTLKRKNDHENANYGAMANNNQIIYCNVISSMVSHIELGYRSLRIERMNLHISKFISHPE